MSQTQRLLMSIIAILLVLVLSFDFSLFWAINHTPNQLNVNYITLHDKKIPESLNDVTIIYFTDLQYGKYQDDKRTKKVFQEIHDLHPDILIFGGDLYDSEATVSDKSNKKLISYLNSIEAPMGKYAVWGEKDWNNEQRKQAVKEIYKKSQIELLHNKNVRISSHDKQSIRLIGLTSTNKLSQALDGVSGKTYNLLVTHKPDNFMAQELANHSISYGLAGHSHGTQITFPIIGPYKEYKGSTKINRENTKKLSFDYAISTGIGCTNVNMRYSSKPEIDVFILKH